MSFNPDDYIVEQRSFPSKDGTKVPMYVVRKRSLEASGTAAPTLLYGYGGFDVALTPGYSAVRMAWLEAGGVFAADVGDGGGAHDASSSFFASNSISTVSSASVRVLT